MAQNRYLEKFQNKTDSQLEYIVENKEKYSEDAVSASINILKDRDVKTAELETVENEIKFEKEKKIIAHKKARALETNKSYLTENPDAPQLHSKKVIFVFCLLFSTIFGAALLMYNMNQTDNGKARIQVIVFGILYTIAFISLISILNIPTNFTFLFNGVGAYILTEYFWNKFIGKEFQYRKRSWIGPAIIAIIITIPLILLTIYGR